MGHEKSIDASGAKVHPLLYAIFVRMHPDKQEQDIKYDKELPARSTC